jgi:DUF1365 family protein
VEGEYRFRLMVSSERTRTVARIDYFDAAGLVIQTSVSGTLEPVTRQALRKAVWTYPLMTLAVVARIHWQAMRLFFKRLSFYRQPPLPSQFISR